METELTQCRAELARVYDFQRRLIEASLDGIVASDQSQVIVIFNRGAGKIMGYCPEEVVGNMGLAELYPPGVGSKVLEDLERPEFGGAGVLENYETTVCTKAGGEVPVWLSASRIRDGDEIMGTVFFFRDLRAKRALEKRVLTAERLCTASHSIAYVAHEIKNPLMVIGGFARQILREGRLSEKSSKKLKLIAHEVERLEEFLCHVTGRTTVDIPQKTTCDIAMLVDELRGLMRQEFEQRRIAFASFADTGIPAVFCDTKQMKQVLLNIFKNSIEAMPEGGQLSVRTLHKESNIEIHIADTGRGIEPENLDRVFETFFTTKVKGTGLGLAICRRIVEDHGGSICATSESGKGTRFTIVLPAGP